MPRAYSDTQKTEALDHLDANFGNVTLTAIQTGIPSRTLYEWKRQRKLRRQQAEPPLLHKKNAVPQQQNATNDDESDSGEYTRIRSRLMQHLEHLLDSLTDDPDTAHLRIIAVTRLLDRVVKLDPLAGNEHEQVIRIEYVQPDGTVHNSSPWWTPETESQANPQPDPLVDHDTEYIPPWRYREQETRPIPGLFAEDSPE